MKTARKYGIIYRFLAAETLRWFGVSFAFFFAIFLVNNILLLAEDILSKSVGVTYVLQLLLFTIPSVLSYTFPFSMLLATLIAAVQHASRFEFLAIQSLGISAFRCYIPIGILGIIFTLSSFVVSDWFIPRASVGFVRLYQNLLFTSPALELEPYSIRQYLDNVVVTGNIEGNVIDNPLIIEPSTKDGLRRVVLAKSAEISANEEGGVLTLSLHEVDGHSRLKDNPGKNYDYFNAQRLDYNILLYALNVSLRPLTPRELRLKDVREYLNDRTTDVATTRRNHLRDIAVSQVALHTSYLQNIATIDSAMLAGTILAESLDQQLTRVDSLITQDIIDQEVLLYETEYHRKISLPAACLFLTLFAFPVGIRLKRANWGIGFGIGLGASVIYWCLLIGGQAYIFQNTQFSSLLIMWIPNIVLGALGVIFAVVHRKR